MNLLSLLTGLPALIKSWYNAFKKPDPNLEDPLGQLDAEKAKQAVEDRRNDRSGNVH